MGKRFSRIKYLLEVAGDKLKNEPYVTGYAGYRLGKKYADAVGAANYNYKVKASKKGTSVTASLTPFSFPSTTGELAVKISGRSALSLGLQSTGTEAGTAKVNGATPTNLNLKTGKDASGQKISGFSPAKAVVFKMSTTGDKTKTSTITGFKYDRRPGSSFTFPFGKKTGDAKKNDELSMRGFLLSQMQGTDQSISFKSETI